jgi:diguanylate cyclase (GGDEF)-like protein
MNLDVTTLLIVNVVNLALTAGTLPFIMGSSLSRGAWFARSALIVQALGWLLMISSEQFTGHWLDRALSVASASSMSLGQWWMFCALSAWLGPRRWGRLLAVVCVLTPIGYFLSFDSYPLRVGWTNLMLALQLVLVAQACLRPASAMSGHWRWVIMGGLWVMAGFTALRGILGAFFTELYPSFTAPHPVNVLAMLVSNGTMVLANVAVLVAWRTEAEAELQLQAQTDPLSGLLNRRGWDSHATPLWSHARRHGLPLGLVMLDLDHFKHINDRYGHETGDQVIRELGSALRTTLRRSDVAARMGGEEFALLLTYSDEAAARTLFARLRLALEQLPISGLEGPVRVSAGLALLAPGDHNLEALRARADAALYLAKDQGRDRLVLATTASAPSSQA